MNDSMNHPSGPLAATETNSGWKAIVLRYLGMGLAAGVAVPALLMSIVLWQEHTERAEAVAELRVRLAHALGPDRLPSPETFYPIEAVSRPPVVEGFHLVAASDTENTPRDDELVLAIRIGEEARAWPLNVMTGPDREIFNDQLAGRSIAATW